MNCSEENEKILIQTLEQYQDQENWEPAAVAASFLGNFTDKEALGSLEEALQSPNWYVRINSAKALVKSKSAGQPADGIRGADIEIHLNQHIYFIGICAII